MRRGLSLMEILISMVILCLVLVGLANVFLAGKRYVTRSRSRMAGAELGGSFLSPLQGNVSYNNLLQIGLWNGTNVTLDKTYTPYYNITVPANLTNQARKVKVEIRWNETQ